jgi:hypothetical protein
MKKTKKTKTKTIDEKELLKVIDIITKKLAYKFKFGYHDIEDMKQQISIFALEGLKNYDHKRPLENFLWTHVRNRLFNYKRDNYQRPDKPCYTCPLFDKSSSLCTKYSNKNDCELYFSWTQRNENKKNLMHLTTIEEIKDYGNAFFDKDISIENQEIINILDEKLTGEYRSIYLKLKGGSKINKSDRDKLYSKVQEILCQKNEDN